MKISRVLILTLALAFAAACGNTNDYNSSPDGDVTENDSGTNPDGDVNEPDSGNPDCGTDGDVNESDSGTNPDGDVNESDSGNPDCDTDGDVNNPNPLFTFTFTGSEGGWVRVYYVKGGSSLVQSFDLVDDSYQVDIYAGEETGTRFIITRGEMSPPVPAIRITTTEGGEFYLFFGEVGQFGSDPNLTPPATDGLYDPGESYGPFPLNLDLYIMTAIQ